MRVIEMLRSPLDPDQARRYDAMRLVEVWSLTRVLVVLASIAVLTLYLREVAFGNVLQAEGDLIFLAGIAWPLLVMPMLAGKPSRQRLLLALVALCIGFSVLAVEGNIFIRHGDYPATTPTFMAILVGLIAVSPNFGTHLLLAAIVMAISCFGLVAASATAEFAAFHVNYMLLTLALTLTYTGCTERRRQRAMRLRDELTAAEKALVAAEIDRARYERDFDGLTGLANRPTFCRRLDQMIAAGGGRPVEIVCFDIEGFNAVNTTHGQAAGDAVLRALAVRVGALNQLVDLGARIGGDEFALALVTPTVEALEARLRAAGMLGQVEIGGIHVVVAAGVARYPDDGRDAATLLSRARAALVDGRARGDAGPTHYTPFLDDALRSRRRLVDDLRAAMAADALQVWFQPQIRLTDGALIGAEALLRWQRGGQMMSPDEFIPVAEEEGLIAAIGAAVLRAAVQAAAGWRAGGFDLRIAVNVSVAQIEAPDFLGIVEAVLAETGLPGHALELEITESLYLCESEPLRRTLAGIRLLGVTLAIDDFGVGHSSLSRLTRLPVRSVKLDRSFVRDLPDDPATCRLVRGAIALARQLDLSVVAEGVETAAQADWLRRRHCNVIQGFLVSAALPPDEFLAFLCGRAAKSAAVE